jgi:hypothetical protein
MLRISVAFIYDHAISEEKDDALHNEFEQPKVYQPRACKMSRKENTHINQLSFSISQITQLMVS